MKRIGSLVPLVVGVALVALLARPPARSSQPQGPHLPPMLPRLELVHLLGASVQQMVADYFWLGTIQQTGVAHTEEEFRDIYDFADLTTDIDPNFAYVYLFAGPAITYNRGRETWVNTDESTKILEKGFARFPNLVLLRVLLAFNYSYYDGQYQKAAALLDETSRMPGAPRYLKALATRLYAQSGRFDAGLALAESAYANATTDAEREEFGERILDIKTERELQRVDAAASEFSKAQGHPPKDVAELVSSGYLNPAPVDPRGGEIFFASDGKSRSTAQGRRLKIYDRKTALGEETP